MITLIGNKLAEKGLTFMHYGAASQCEKCRFKNTCIETLEEGRLYFIKEVKDTQHPCLLHEGRMVRVVEVDRAFIKGLISSKKAFEGSNVVFKPPECDVECKFSDLCFPEGLYADDKCKIIKNLGNPSEKCPKGLNLSLVLLK
jgi:uncharacterized protein